MQRAAGHRLRDQLVQSRLRDRAAAGPDLIDLGGVDVNSPDVVAIGGQAGGRHRPDIAEPDHCDLHTLPGRRASFDTRGTCYRSVEQTPVTTPNPLRRRDFSGRSRISRMVIN